MRLLLKFWHSCSLSVWLEFLLISPMCLFRRRSMSGDWNTQKAFEPLFLRRVSCLLLLSLSIACLSFIFHRSMTLASLQMGLDTMDWKQCCVARWQNCERASSAFKQDEEENKQASQLLCVLECSAILSMWTGFLGSLSFDYVSQNVNLVSRASWVEILVLAQYKLFMWNLRKPLCPDW